MDCEVLRENQSGSTLPAPQPPQAPSLLTAWEEPTCLVYFGIALILQDSLSPFRQRSCLGVGRVGSALTSKLCSPCVQASYDKGFHSFLFLWVSAYILAFLSTFLLFPTSSLPFSHL